MVLFRNIRDGQQVSALGKQMFQGNNKALVEAYENTTSCKYGYLVTDSTAKGDVQVENQYISWRRSFGVCSDKL